MIVVFLTFDPLLDANILNDRYQALYYRIRPFLKGKGSETV